MYLESMGTDETCAGALTFISHSVAVSRTYTTRAIHERTKVENRYGSARRSPLTPAPTVTSRPRRKECAIGGRLARRRWRTVLRTRGRVQVSIEHAVDACHCQVCVHARDGVLDVCVSVRDAGDDVRHTGMQGGVRALTCSRGWWMRRTSHTPAARWSIALSPSPRICASINSHATAVSPSVASAPLCVG